ncbi:related to pisatin demethylase cytochrome P450 [Rhynchosporium secalis]|uniref:Related to pisatin demethylase cytochrome P450 n=1 Tax=Rhynchosporium secalis TaxID=38038 RepID=A0A1E1LZK6_RHYSE|nr:related to pisatin demethylase cytochrome P450 [Rhynchosporium secalis]
MLPKTGGHGYVCNYTLRQIEDRQQALKDSKNADIQERPDITTKILLAHEENPSKMTKIDLITVCQSNFVAGSDTTAITLSSIFYHLLKYSTRYRNAERDRCRFKDIESSHVQEAQNELPYLQAVIKKALRIHSATGLPMQRVVPPEWTTIAGQFIPGGASVNINAWVAHRNQSVFGNDAKEWRPERWLEFEEQGRGREVERYMLAFGMGSRTCIGKNISLLEISKAVPQLVRNFDFVLEEECSDDLKCLNRWFVKQLNFRGRVMARQARMPG